MLGNRRYCYPLTITDFASRYLLTCEALSTTQENFAFTVFERTFKEFGLPQTIRTDNGVPFASAHALYGLSKLGLVAAPRHPPRAHQARPSAARRRARTHAPHPEDRSHQARRRQRASTTSPVRRLPQAVKPQSAPPGRRHESVRRSLRAIAPRLPGDLTTSPIPSTTTRSPSPDAAGSASSGTRSISARSSQDSTSASRRPPSTSGS